MRSFSLRHAAVVAVCGLALQQFGWAAAFKGASTFPAHLAPDSIVVADFNGDGNLDLAIANRSSNDISVLMGKGDGTFITGVKYSSGAGTNPFGIATADVNGDGKPDLVVANAGNKTIAVLMNTGTGTFNPAVAYTVGNVPSSVAAADITGDGVADIAVTNSSDNTVTVLFNNGSGTFTKAGTYATDAAPHSVAIADFNGDGSNDLVVANQNGNDVSVLLNQGAGAFNAAVNYCVVSTTGNCNAISAVSPVSVIAVDLTGDGKPDLAVASLSKSVVTLVNNGSGVFTLTAQAPDAQVPEGLAAGNFNTDTHPDLVIADNATNSFEIINGAANGGFGGAARYLAGKAPMAIAVGDFNKDGKLDVAVVNNTDNNVSVALGNGDGTFQDIQSFLAGSNVRSVVAGDFNGDGKTDFLVNATSGSTFSVDLFIGNAKGAFQLSTTVPFASDVYDIATGDFDQNKKLDFVVANQTSNEVSVVLGNGTGGFSSAATYATDAGPVSAAVGDFNLDGYPDIVTANTTADDVSGLLNTKTCTFNAAVLMNKGDGTFAAAVTYAVGNGPTGIAVAELNADLFADLVITNKTDNSISVLLGNGDGTFQTAVNYVVPTSAPVAVTVADITADGILDLVVAQSTNAVGVMAGKGDGTFSGSVNYKVGVTPIALATNDLNVDGKVDVFVANAGGGDVTVLLNQTPAAAMSASATKLTYGNVQVGSSSSSQTVTLTNKGNTTLTIASIATSADYPMTTNCGGALGSLATCTITITFSPSYIGAINGQLTITGNVTGNYLTVPLTGTGQVPMVVSPVTLSLGTVAVGSTSAPQTVTVINQTSSTITYTISATSNYNAVGSGTTPCNGTLAGLAKCTVSVTMTPTQAGAINGSFIVSGSSFMPQITSLSGTGTGGPTLPVTFNPTSLLFDSPALGFSSLPKNVTATNSSSSTVNLTLTASTDWSVSGSGTKPCGGALTAGSSCTFAVVFTPSVLGYFNGSISVATGSGNPIIYDLEGLGNLDSSFSPGSMTFAPQAVGTTSPGQVVKVWNFENSNMTLVNWSSSGDFQALPGPSTMQPCSPGGQVPPLLKPYCTLTVYFTPTKVGPITGAITVTTGWATGSESFAVTGTGQ